MASPRDPPDGGALGEDDAEEVTDGAHDDAAHDEATVGASMEGATDATDTMGEPERSAALVPAQLAGRYQILEEIGRGGMGTVYRAFDTRLGRHVALKLVASTASRRHRLLREAQALALLSHPNVVPVYDVGVVDEMVFMATELIDGVDLRRWLERAPRTPRDVLRVFAAAGDGLAAAHAAGLVHRDFKPGNVLIGDDGRVRVLDFGLARPMAPADEPTSPSGPLSEPRTPAMDDDGGRDSSPLRSSLTRVGHVVGTPRYMAPEQRRGTADARSDQFSFCLALYEALYGEPPFTSREARRHFDDQGLPAIEPPVRRGVPTHVRRVLRRGLRWQAAARYPSMAAVVAQLRRDLRAVPVRIAVAAAALGAVAAAATAGIVVGQEPEPCGGAGERAASVWPSTLRGRVERALLATDTAQAPWVAERLLRQVDGYVRDWSALRTETCRATRVHGEQSERVMDRKMSCLDDNLDQVAAYLVALAGAATESAMNRGASEFHKVSSLSLCEDAEALARREQPVAVDELMTVAVLRRATRELNALTAVGDVEAATPVARRVLDLAGRVRHVETRAQAMHAYAEAERWRGELTSSARAVDQTLRLAAQANNRTLVADSWASLLWHAAVEERRTVATQELLRATEVALLMAGDEPEHARLESEIGHIIATVHLHTGNLPLSEERFRAVLARPQFPPRRSATLNNLGLVLLYRSKLDEARTALAESRQIDETTFGTSHPYFADDALNLGLTHHWQGDGGTAERWYRKALDHSVAHDGPGIKNALFHLYLGHVLVDRGAWTEAAGQLDNALAGYGAMFGPDAEFARHARVQRARLRLERGDLAGARADIDEVAAAQVRAGDLDRLVPGYLDPLVIEGRVALAEGRKDAEATLRRSLDRYRALYGVDGLPLAEPLLALGDVALASGRPAAAFELADRTLDLLHRARSDGRDPRRARALELRAAARRGGAASDDDLRAALAIWEAAGHPRADRVRAVLSRVGTR